MTRTVGIGIQDFEKLIISNSFYVDKTSFSKQWCGHFVRENRESAI